MSLLPPGPATERALAAILASAMDAIVAVDEGMRIVLFNAAAERMLRCPAGEALGGSVERFIPPPARGRHEAGMRGFASGALVPRQMGAGREIEVLRADGSRFMAEASISHAAAGDGRLYLVVLRDATQRLEAEARLHELNATLESRVQHRTESLLAAVAEMESFCYTLSHDLRAPLRAISGYSQMVLEDEAHLGEEARRRLGEVCENAARMTRLIDGLIAFARLARAEPALEPVDLGALAREAVERRRAEGTLGRARVVVGALPWTRADRGMMREVMEALIGNAVKFSSRSEAPHIEVGCATREGDREVFVSDNGAGFDMRYAGKLFGVFERLHHPQDFDGIGLGLAMARRILALHGRRIRGEGRPGAGATFAFTVEPIPSPAGEAPPR